MVTDANRWKGPSRAFVCIVIGLLFFSCVVGFAGANTGSFAACPQGYQCLWEAEAWNLYGTNYEKYSSAPCGRELLVEQMQNKYCYRAKPPENPYWNVTVQPAPGVANGSLSIASSPSGASVTVDGQYRGTTPLTVGDLSAGSHALRLSLPGYSDAAQSPIVSAGQTTAISISLIPISAPKGGGGGGGSGSPMNGQQGADDMVGSIPITDEVEFIPLPEENRVKPGEEKYLYPGANAPEIYDVKKVPETTPQDIITGEGNMRPGGIGTLPDGTGVSPQTQSGVAGVIAVTERKFGSAPFNLPGQSGWSNTKSTGEFGTNQPGTNYGNPFDPTSGGTTRVDKNVIMGSLPSSTLGIFDLAQKIVTIFIVGGMSDTRLPTKEEMQEWYDNTHAGATEKAMKETGNPISPEDLPVAPVTPEDLPKAKGKNKQPGNDDGSSGANDYSSGGGETHAYFMWLAAQRNMARYMTLDGTHYYEPGTGPDGETGGSDMEKMYIMGAINKDHVVWIHGSAPPGWNPDDGGNGKDLGTGYYFICQIQRTGPFFIIPQEKVPAEEIWIETVSRISPPSYGAAQAGSAQSGAAQTGTAQAAAS